jgi:hypothetical protein
MGRPPVSSPKQSAAGTERAGELPDVRATGFSQPTHDFTLQAVMELKGSVGQLIAKVDRLVSDVGEHGKKIEKINQKIAWVAGAGAAAGAIFAALLGIVVVVVKFIPFK